MQLHYELAAPVRTWMDAVQTAIDWCKAERQSTDEAHLLRYEVPIEADKPPLMDILADFDGRRRVFWRDRDDRLQVGGVGEAWSVGGLSWTMRDGLAELVSALQDAPGRMRVFGGVCFSGELRSTGPWKDFGAWRFALPRVEFGIDQDGAWLALHLKTAPQRQEDDIVQALDVLHAFTTPPKPQSKKAAKPLDIADLPDLAQWTNGVDSALKDIEAGVFRKVVFARRRRVRFSQDADPMHMFIALSTQEQATFRFFVQPAPDSAFFGASPERLFSLRGDRILTEALAGTRPRGATDAQDSALATELLNSDKDGREHDAVVQMLTGALQQLSESVELDRSPQVMQLTRVQHLYTPIVARARCRGQVAETLDGLHPTPAVCGSPRDAAQRWITQNEPFQRGLYAAPVGWVGGGGDADFTVAIRSALLQDRHLDVFSGAGLVAGSDAQTEWQEIDHKIAALCDALEVPWRADDGQ
ncbi:MAG TPA: hypothetical protein DCQ06_07330 [Myxococcales bacterium]|nr:hypothetical protein [Myxococcales bacterium]HAN31393.1 hypothetical protein [Myxococcales bacterium]